MCFLEVVSRALEGLGCIALVTFYKRHQEKSSQQKKIYHAGICWYGNDLLSRSVPRPSTLSIVSHAKCYNPSTMTSSSISVSGVAGQPEYYTTADPFPVDLVGEFNIMVTIVKCCIVRSNDSDCLFAILLCR